MTSPLPPGPGGPTSRPAAPGTGSDDGAPCGGCGDSRRAFLERAAVLGSAGLAATGLAGCTDRIRAQDAAPSRPVGGSRTRAIATAELPVGTSASVRLEGRTLLLRRASEDTVHAYSAVCTHQGCTVAPATEGGEDVFACPCHGSHFAVDTGVPFGGPARRPLTAYEAAVDGDWVTVTL